MDEHRFRFHGDLCLRLTLLPCGLVEREGFEPVSFRSVRERNAGDNR
jgi:hypothetical protein